MVNRCNHTKLLSISRMRQEIFRSQWSLSTFTRTNRALDSNLKLKESHQESLRFIIQPPTKDRLASMNSVQESKFRKKLGLPMAASKNVMVISWRTSLSINWTTPTCSSVLTLSWKRMFFFWKSKESQQSWTSKPLKTSLIEVIPGPDWHSFIYQRELRQQSISQLKRKTKKNRRWRYLLRLNISMIWSITKDTEFTSIALPELLELQLLLWLTSASSKEWIAGKTSKSQTNTWCLTTTFPTQTKPWWPK